MGEPARKSGAATTGPWERGKGGERANVPKLELGNEEKGGEERGSEKIVPSEGFQAEPEVLSAFGPRGGLFRAGIGLFYERLDGHAHSSPKISRRASARLSAWHRSDARQLPSRAAFSWPSRPTMP